MFWKYPLKVQAYNSQTDDWYEKEFLTQEEHIEYIQAQFPQEPQFYKLKNTKKWKETGQAYSDTVTKPNFGGGRYHSFTRGSNKEREWRRKEVARIKNGVIYDGIYIPPFYYWYLNFCPIIDDIDKKIKFANVWDSDLWYMQYCMLAILQGYHIGGVKGRQKGYSFKHMAILCWGYWWFEASVNTMVAYDEDLVKKSWRYLQIYRNHINQNTTWKRGPTQPKALEWNEVQLDEEMNEHGLRSILKAVTVRQKADKDVGGPQTFFNYEEPGVAPNILEVLEYIRPAVEKGSFTTGIIIACGSVGDLDDAEGLKEIFYSPRSYNFLPVKNVWDDDPISEESCIFISEAYNMLGSDKEGLVEKGRPFMDEDGNSDVEFSLKWIEAKKKRDMADTKKKKELRQLALSQKCTSPAQAFDQRKTSEWPVDAIIRQQERIKHKEANNLWEKKPLKGLYKEVDGRSVFDQTLGGPEHHYPINPEWEDKRGVWTIYVEPGENPEAYTFFATVDAIEVDQTSTSESIASVDIFQTVIEVKYTDENGKTQTRIEGDKLAATYRGRFPTAELTNEQIWLGIRAYNAWTYAERNKPNFINYMRRNGRSERYLAKEGDVPLFKDLNIKNGNSSNNSKFGFHKGDNTEIWKHFKSTAKEYFAAEYGRITITRADGSEDTVKVITGLDKIDDYWLLEEFKKHVEGKGNYDRMVSFLGALFICKVYQQNRFVKRRDETKKDTNKQPTPRKPISLLGGIGRTTVNKRSRKPYSLI